MTDEINLEILNFVDLKKRQGGIKVNTWMPISNDLLNHPDFFEISSDEFKVFFWVMCVTSKANKAEIRIHVGLCAHQTRISKKTIVLTIEKLNEKRWRVRDAIAARPPIDLSTFARIEEKRVEENRLNNVQPPPEGRAMDARDLDSIYEKYPKHEGKARGIKTLLSQKLLKSDIPLLEKSRDKYAALQIGVEKKYIKLFSTWASCWRDYLDDDVGTCTFPKQKSLRERLIEQGEVFDDAGAV